MNSDCIFCRIAGKQSPAYIIEETEDFICFFPIKPDCYGHTLIVSTRHHRHVADCPPALGEGLFLTAQKLFRRYQQRIGATGFNLLNANGPSAEQSIDHLHFHFLPRFPDDGLSAWPTFPPNEPDLDALFHCLVTSG